MFDATDQILNELGAREDGRAELKAARLADRGVLSPKTEDLAGELLALTNADVTSSTRSSTGRRGHSKLRAADPPGPAGPRSLFRQAAAVRALRTRAAADVVATLIFTHARHRPGTNTPAKGSRSRV